MKKSELRYGVLPATTLSLPMPPVKAPRREIEKEIDEMERWDRIDDLRDAVVAALREIDGPKADIEVKWREVRLRRDGHLVCCIPMPLLEGVDAEQIPGIVRSYLEAFDCGWRSVEPSVPFQIDREPVDPELEALRQKKVGEIRASLDQAAAISRVASEIPEEYKWDVEDLARGPFGEAEGLIYGIAIDRIIDFAVGKLDERRITEAREDLRRLRELSGPTP